MMIDKKNSEGYMDPTTYHAYRTRYCAYYFKNK